MCALRSIYKRMEHLEYMCLLHIFYLCRGKIQARSNKYNTYIGIVNLGAGISHCLGFFVYFKKCKLTWFVQHDVLFQALMFRMLSGQTIRLQSWACE